ncbi:polyprenyl synthetase family protein [Amycolatopsis sp. DG1A-15b]|uniref:polyprenyl synthetase family protein n=1 Tax=Amycolatopsis sp. DG1A-15b TaxID=3052846 RepID=UPI00255BF5F4|nr:polyprenyl synthetase family protein [Amycolatopsis sp. DG1A-15b]WIX91329.1 polyprenyl synthetase family protein [Amycolatopsis sp. DG1A-15b]
MSGIEEGVGRFVADVRFVLADIVTSLAPELRDCAQDLTAHSGKNFRARLLYLCARFGRPSRRRLVRSGALVELLHVASLMHDDVIDRAATRRGRPTAHAVAGNEVAVLTGVGCLALVGQEAAALGSAVSRLMSDATADLAYGELLDIERAFDTGLSDEDYLSLVAHKTGTLFKLAAVVGAQEAGVQPDDVVRLAAFGEQVGVAFQIADDCLDLWASATGKPRGTDHLLGLFGLPTLYALRAGSPGLKELLLSPRLGLEDLETVGELVRHSDGIDRAMAVARAHRDRARLTLGPLAHGELGAALVGLSEDM